jgi:hypothetical protein
MLHSFGLRAVQQRENEKNIRKEKIYASLDNQT